MDESETNQKSRQIEMGRGHSQLASCGGTTRQNLLADGTSRVSIAQHIETLDGSDAWFRRALADLCGKGPQNPLSLI